MAGHRFLGDVIFAAGHRSPQPGLGRLRKLRCVDVFVEEFPEFVVDRHPVNPSALFLEVDVRAPAPHPVIPDFHGDHRAHPGEGVNEDSQQGPIPEVPEGYRRKRIKELP